MSEGGKGRDHSMVGIVLAHFTTFVVYAWQSGRQAGRQRRRSFDSRQRRRRRSPESTFLFSLKVAIVLSRLRTNGFFPSLSLYPLSPLSIAQPESVHSID